MHYAVVECKCPDLGKWQQARSEYSRRRVRSPLVDLTARHKNVCIGYRTAAPRLGRLSQTCDSRTIRDRTFRMRVATYLIAGFTLIRTEHWGSLVPWVVSGEIPVSCCCINRPHYCEAFLDGESAPCGDAVVGRLQLHPLLRIQLSPEIVQEPKFTSVEHGIHFRTITNTLRVCHSYFCRVCGLGVRSGGTRGSKDRSSGSPSTPKDIGEVLLGTCLVCQIWVGHKSGLDWDPHVPHPGAAVETEDQGSHGPRGGPRTHVFSSSVHMNNDGLQHLNCRPQTDPSWGPA